MENVDITGFKFKMKAVKIAYAEAVVKELRKGAQEIYNAASKNLSGHKDRYVSGTLPVRRITGTLSRSLQMKPVSNVEWLVYADKNIAYYAGYVHDGTKRMRPRRFLHDPVRERRPAIQNRIKRQLLKAIRREGRA